MNPFIKGDWVVYMPNVGNSYGFLHKIAAGIKMYPKKGSTVLLEGVKGEVPVSRCRIATLCEIKNGKANNDM